MALIRYRVADGHRTQTVRGGETLNGSIHHPEISEFAGLVTRSHEDGTHDIVIFPPDKPQVHVHSIPEGEAGDEPGTLSFIGDRAPSKKRRGE